jgi:hypothetical protein
MFDPLRHNIWLSNLKIVERGKSTFLHLKYQVCRLFFSASWTVQLGGRL